MSLPPLPRTAPPADDGTDQTLYLLGATRLPEYLDFVRERVIGGRDMDRTELADDWREAAALYRELETTEAGAADKPPVKPLPAALQRHVEALAELPNFRKTFATVPVAFGLVELDRLVVYQHRIAMHAVDRMTARPGPLDDAALADICLPLGTPPAAFRMVAGDDHQMVFESDNHDARFLEPQLVDPADIAGFTVNGHAQAVLALAVGFTTNVLNVVRHNNRLVLNNGYHRAYALRALGVTHAPCLIQVCSHWEDVALVASSEIYDNATLYFSAPRPPLLRDFLNPELTRRFATHRMRKQIRISFEAESIQLIR